MADNVSRETIGNTVAQPPADEANAKVRAHGHEAFKRFMQYDFRTAYDVGSGHGKHAEAMRRVGRHVVTVDNKSQADDRRDWGGQTVMEPLDAIWCSHALEHALNVHQWCRAFHQRLHPGGVLCVTVPPGRADLDRGMIGGHINHFTPWSLCYHLVLAGFDCREARVGTYGHNMSVIVTKPTTPLPTPLGVRFQMNHGDLARLAPFMPVTISKGGPATWQDVNW